MTHETTRRDLIQVASLAAAPRRGGSRHAGRGRRPPAAAPILGGGAHAGLDLLDRETTAGRSRASPTAR
jgi:hypothetical protein